MLIMEHVSKIYRTKKRTGLFRGEWQEINAVQDLSLEIAPGEIVGLLGINGAGKTTTIKMCATLLEPSGGSIRIGGFDAVKQARQVKHLVNMIAGGERMLYWRLTGRENLDYFGSLYGLTAADLAARIPNLLHEVGLEEAADLPVERYSKGMKQRLQIARGLINDPQYIFLDEPTLGLDVAIAKHLRHYVKNLVREKEKAILLTSHYIQEVEELCDRVFIIDKGRLVAQGTPASLARSLFKESTLRITVPALSSLLAESLEKLKESHSFRWESRPALEEGTELIISSAENLTPGILELLAKQGTPVLQLTSEQPKLEDAVLLLAEGGPGLKGRERNSGLEGKSA